MRTRDAIELLEAVDPVDAAVFDPPELDVDALPATPIRRRRVRRALAPAAAAAVAAAAVVVASPGTGDDDVVARAAAAVSGERMVFTRARKIEYGRVVTRELSWTAGDRVRRLVYRPDGELESEIVESPEGVTQFVAGARRVDVFPPGVRVPAELSGDPLTLLARARDGRDGLAVVGEDRIGGERVHVIEARSPDAVGATRIAVSAETYLPVTATLGLSTYEYDRVETLPENPRMLAPALGASQARVCVHDLQAPPACSRRRWP